MQTAYSTRVPYKLDDQVFFLQLIEEMIDVAAGHGTNILAFPELFTMPYPFHTPSLINWQEYAETEKGKTFQLMKRMALQHNIVIIYSILELSDDKRCFNTCFVVSNRGELIGKCRKYHIPPIEAPYITPGDFDPPVFETDFGKIGILICYERHFPLRWLLLASKGAEIIFNPSSEDESGLSEKMWEVECLNAAVANGVVTVAINRCGSETFEENTFNYFGNSYVASPYGTIESVNSQDQRVCVVEIDLNGCKKAKEGLSFHKNQKISKYAEKLSEIYQNKKHQAE
ncbi:beta-ureidopropionase-like [Chironomus tepperi]|uniref:beta-ureidopropionase-like n=1 Tax=Chironomus tepperi TaxID=113505 RepID=UPI00391EF6E0